MQTKKMVLICWNHVWKYSYLAIALIVCILLLPILLLWLWFLDCLAAHGFNLFIPQITPSFTLFGIIWCCKHYGWRRKEIPVIPTFFLVPPVSLRGVIYLFDTDNKDVHKVTSTGETSNLQRLAIKMWRAQTAQHRWASSRCIFHRGWPARCVL